MARKAMLATVHILIDIENSDNAEAEAADVMSGLLTETGIYDGTILDWSYEAPDGVLRYARPVEIPEDYDRDEEDLAAIARSHHPGVEA